MKTIKKDDIIKRVSDNKSEAFIEAGWSYIPKKEWKAKRGTLTEKKVSKKVTDKNN